MKVFITILFAILVLTIGHTQTLVTTHVGNGGKQLTSSRGSIHFNIGEVAIMQNERIREGVIQYFPISTLVNDKASDLVLKVYPNPSSGSLYLEEEGRVLEWYITDNTGRTIDRIIHDSPNTHLNLERLMNGTYYAVAITKIGAEMALPFQIIH